MIVLLLGFAFFIGSIIIVFADMIEEKKIEADMIEEKKIEQLQKKELQEKEQIRIEELQELLANHNIKNIIFNFYKNVHDDVFLDFNTFIIMEKSIRHYHDSYNLDSFCVLFCALLSSTFERENLIEENTIINEEIYNRFKMLTQIIEKKIKEESKTFENMNFVSFIYITWKLLTKFAIEYYSDQWEKEYGKYFKNDEIGLDKYIKIYCSIDCLDADNISNAGLFTYFLMNKNKFLDNNQNFLTCNKTLIAMLSKEIENKKLENFEKQLCSQTKEKNKNYNIYDVDMMDGLEFENFIAFLFSKMGYSTNITKASGDQGIDVIAEKNGQKFGIQAKCYSDKVSNSAIQEVVAGINHYNLNKGIVITNNYFSKSAVELAQSNNIILWDRNKLKEKISEVFIL